MDEQSTVANDAPAEQQDATQPTSQEETQDTDVELEDMDFTDDELNPDEDEETEAELEESPASDDSDEEESTDEGEAQEAEKQTEQETEDDTTSEDIKKRNDEYAKRRIAEKQAIELARQTSEKEYLDAAEDEKDLALRQLQVDAYNNKVERATTKLETGLERAKSNIDMLNKGTPEQKEELLNRLDVFEQMYVVKDRFGNPLEVKADVYEYLTQEAERIQRLVEVGARQGKRSESKTKARTLTPPSAKPREAKKDTDLEDFDSAWN